MITGREGEKEDAGKNPIILLLSSSPCDSSPLSTK
jgi:hypothetical protein